MINHIFMKVVKFLKGEKPSVINEVDAQYQNKNVNNQMENCDNSPTTITTTNTTNNYGGFTIILLFLIIIIAFAVIAVIVIPKIIIPKYSDKEDSSNVNVTKNIYINVMFDANGGYVAISNTNILLGEQYNLPDATREYYTFDGWYTSRDGGKKVDKNDVITNRESHILYAHWTEKMVEVEYDTDGGVMSGSTQETYILGSKYINKTATKSGYTLVGWYTERNGNGTKILETSLVTNERNHTLYAYWSNNICNVKFDANGGTVKPLSINVALGDKYGTLPTPERTGYIFDGWYMDKNGENEIGENSIVNDTEGVTLYAHWSSAVYTVSFNANGGSCDTANKNVQYGKSYGNLPTPTKTGNTFEGWYTSVSGGSKVSSDAIYDTNGDTTLYAHWSSAVYTVSFNANGGSCDTANKNVQYGKSYGNLPTPTKTGNTFEGWYTSVSGGSKVSSDAIYDTNGDTTLYAHWSSAVYTVSFNANGGSCDTANKNVQYGKSYGNLPTPTKTGNTFEGWYTSVTGGNRVTSDSIYNKAGNITLYARWKNVYVSSISLNKDANDTIYYIGDKISTAGAVIKVTYNDGTTKSISGGDCEVIYPDTSTEGSKTVKLNYGGKQTSYKITVKKPTISIGGGVNGKISSTLTASYNAGKQQSISIKWSSSDTNIATVDGDGKVTFKNRGNNAENGSATITASYTYMGKTYSASRTVKVEYGSWSGWSTTAVSANDNRQVQTREQSKTETTTNEQSSLSGWTYTGKNKQYTSDWSGPIYRYSSQKPNDDGNGTEYQLAYEDWRYFHYHNYNAGSIDSVQIANCLGYCEFFKDDTAVFGQGSASDRGGRPLSQNYWDYNHYNNCPYGYEAYWRDRNYIYKQRTYKYVYSYSKTNTWTEYKSRTINYTY